MTLMLVNQIKDIQNIMDYKYNVVVIMVDTIDLDLDILVGRQKKVRLNGKEIVFKDITMEEHLEAELIVKQLEAVPLFDKKDVKEASDLKNKYLMKILDITKADAMKVTLKQYLGLRRFIDRQDMYDQGFTDKDIDMIEKKALKKQMAQIK